MPRSVSRAEGIKADGVAECDALARDLGLSDRGDLFEPWS
jgi:hypothetical protein